MLDLQNLFEKFNQTKVLLIGDAMIDAYQWGTVERMSPEAPVPVVSVHKKEKRLGGAGNVAINLKGLGATPYLCSLVGDDEHAQTMKEIMESEQLPLDGLFEVQGRPTTIKTRVISHGKHVLRLDEEDTNELKDYSNFLSHLKNLLDKIDFNVIIFQDYNKGTLHKDVIETVTGWAKNKNIPIAVDPKKKNFLAYREVDLFKPNLKELAEGLQKDISPLPENGLMDSITELNQHLNAAEIMVTLSENGVIIKDHNGEFHHLPAHPRRIVDVSGAGDTVISVASLALAQRIPAKHLAFLANLSGGLVCEEVGVVPIDKEKLFSEASRLAQEL